MLRRLLTIICFFAVLCVAASAAEKRFTLVIDPGHGGADAGAKGAISKEKDINLKVALAFGRLVEANCPDVKVVYTRKRDVFVALHERANIANRNKADLFVSIHTNALPKGKIARGLETYTLGMHRAADNFDVAKRENSVILFEDNYEQHYEGFDPNSSESYIMFEFLQDRNMAQSVEMARYVQKRTCAQTGRANKGVKQAGFLVLRETSMPGCLIELGFITTRDEERYLNTSAGVEAMGRGIYQAFLDYKKKYGGGTSVDYKPEQSAPEPQPAPKPATAQPQAQASKPQAEAAQPQPAAATQQAQASTEPAKAEPQAPATRVAEPQVASAEAAPEPSATAPQPANGGAAVDGEPVFKVQIMASGKQLAPTDARFSGLEGVECYEEGGMYKYTCGPTTNYNAALKLRRQLAERFAGAFVVAFINGQKANTAEAVNIFKQNRNKR